MKRLSGLIILMIIVSIIAWVISSQDQEILGKSFGYIAGGSSVLGAVSIVLKYINKKNRNKQILQDEIFPTVSPLLTILEVSKNFTEKQIGDITSQIEGNLEKDDKLNSMIVLIASKFCTLMKVDLDFHKPYSLALAYKMVEAKKTRLGISQKQIEHTITFFKKIRCGNDSWELSDDIISQYHKFSSLENLLLLEFKQAKKNADEIDAKKAGENKKIIYDEASVLHKIIKNDESKLKKLLSIIHDDVPLPDFLKILASLETDIVLISEQGMSDPLERAISKTAKSGKMYVDEVLEKRGLKLGKLNHAVSIAFLHDITEGKNPLFFDLKAWGNQIEKEANELREQANAEKRKFNFALLRTPIHELHAFGDELGERSRIKIDDETLARLNSQDFTISTLATIGQILRENKKLSLYEFINKNIRYLEGIPDKEMAQKISEHFCEKFKKNEWHISHFIEHTVTKDDFIGLNFSDDQINKILSESKKIHEILK